MVEQPLVTVGAVNYNNERFVIETLESIRNQSYPNIELIIVDDCSTDNSVAKIRAWLEDYRKPYKLIVHEQNTGVCRSFNDVLKNATGAYLSTIATDDIMLPDKLAVQVALLESLPETVGAVYSDAYLMKEDSSPRYGWFIQRQRDFADLPDGNIYGELLNGNFLPAMSVLVRSSCFKEVGAYDEDLPYEDYDMWLRIARKYEFRYSDYVSVRYRIRSGSLVSSIRNWYPSLVRIYMKHTDQPGVMAKLEQVAKNAYTGKNADTLKLFKKLNLNNSYIRKVLLFHDLNVPISLGFRILDRIKKN